MGFTFEITVYLSVTLEMDLTLDVRTRFVFPLMTEPGPALKSSATLLSLEAPGPTLVSGMF